MPFPSSWSAILYRHADDRVLPLIRRCDWFFMSLSFFCRSSLVQVRLNFCRQWKKNRSNWRVHFSYTLDMKRKPTAGSMEQRWTLQATLLLSLSMNSVAMWIIFNYPWTISAISCSTNYRMDVPSPICSTMKMHCSLHCYHPHRIYWLKMIRQGKQERICSIPLQCRTMSTVFLPNRNRTFHSIRRTWRAMKRLCPVRWRMWTTNFWNNWFMNLRRSKNSNTWSINWSETKWIYKVESIVSNSKHENDRLASMISFVVLCTDLFRHDLSRSPSTFIRVEKNLCRQLFLSYSSVAMTWHTYTPCFVIFLSSLNQSLWSTVMAGNSSCCLCFSSSNKRKTKCSREESLAEWHLLLSFIEPPALDSTQWVLISESSTFSWPWIERQNRTTTPVCVFSQSTEGRTDLASRWKPFSFSRAISLLRQKLTMIWLFLLYKSKP